MRAAALLLAVTALLTGCGVTAQDEPHPLVTSDATADPTPTLTERPAPTTSTGPSPTTPVPTAPTSTGG